MRTLFKLCVLVSLTSNTAVFAADSGDKLNLSGRYKCTGYDSHDGNFTGVATLSLDAAASDFEHNFGAYKVAFKADMGGVEANYSGFASVQGENIAIFFENNNKKDPIALTDRGVAIASLSHDQDANGKFTTTMHMLYYLPDYQRNAKDKKGPGGRGSETCVKTQ